MNYFLGIDTSTTSSKALLIDSNGNVIAVASSPHTLQTPKPLWSEQNPAEWWDAVSASIKAVLEKAGISGEQVAAVGLTGQMHGLVLLDEGGNVLRPAILWNDQRTQTSMRRNPSTDRQRKIYSDHRQRCVDGIHCAENFMGAGK